MRVVWFFATAHAIRAILFYKKRHQALSCLLVAKQSGSCMCKYIGITEGTYNVCFSLQRREDPLQRGGASRLHVSLWVQALQDRMIKILLL